MSVECSATEYHWALANPATYMWLAEASRATTCAQAEDPQHHLETIIALPEDFFACVA